VILFLLTGADMCRKGYRAAAMACGYYLR